MATMVFLARLSSAPRWPRRGELARFPISLGLLSWRWEGGLAYRVATAPSPVEEIPTVSSTPQGLCLAKVEKSVLSNAYHCPAGWPAEALEPAGLPANLVLASNGNQSRPAGVPDVVLHNVFVQKVPCHGLLCRQEEVVHCPGECGRLAHLGTVP